MTEVAPRPRAGARRRLPIGLLFIGLWVALLVAIYIVIVQLKLGGAEALREPEPTGEPASAPAAAP